MTPYLVALAATRGAFREGPTLHLWAWPRPVCADPPFERGAEARRRAGAAIFAFPAEDDPRPLCRRCLRTVDTLVDLVDRVEGRSKLAPRALEAGS